jgi:hypothetical protein
MPGTSPVLGALKNAVDAGNGLFVRYCTYLLVPQISSQQLAADFAAGSKTINPAIGKVLGSIGVWDPSQAATLAEGRRLRPSGVITFNHGQFTLNPTTVRVNATDHRISVDLINTVPELDENLEKVELGPLVLALQHSSGGIPSQSVLGVVPNTRLAYEARAGMVDFPVPDPVWPFVGDGRLQLIQQSTGSVLLDEGDLVIESDDRATYLQQNQSTTIRVKAWSRGLPAPSVSVKIQQFSTTNKTFALVPPATPVVQCPDEIVTQQDGSATLAIQGVNPGCCTLRFTGPDEPDATDYFVCVRVLPLDDYSGVPDNQLNFALLYREILQYYHLLHPAMDAQIDLSSEAAVRAAVDSLRARTKGTAWDNPAFMPRTRELSAGKLGLLLRWCALVAPPSNPVADQ